MRVRRKKVIIRIQTLVTRTHTHTQCTSYTFYTYNITEIIL